LFKLKTRTLIWADFYTWRLGGFAREKRKMLLVRFLAETQRRKVVRRKNGTRVGRISFAKHGFGRIFILGDLAALREHKRKDFFKVSRRVAESQNL
jgi:hypothetical protein